MNIGIIGGGASGMIAAIAAARKGAEVTVLEGGDRIGSWYYRNYEGLHTRVRGLHSGGVARGSF